MSGGDPGSFDELAEHYRQRESLDGDPVGEWLERMLPVSGGSALDLGCGAGRHAAILAQRFDSVVAIDASEPMLRLARTDHGLGNVEYRLGNLFDVAGSYDLVFSSATLHHVEDLAAALRHVKALVAAGGTVIIVDVVAFRPRIPRWLFRLNALARLAGGLVARQPHARDRYRLATDAAWLDHLTADRYLSRRGFEARYGAVFPDAEFHRIRNLHACVWTAAHG